MGSQPVAVAAGIGTEAPHQGFEIRHVLCPMLRMLRTLLVHKVFQKETVVKSIARRRGGKCLGMFRFAVAC